MTNQTTTKVEDLLCRIASRQRIAEECREKEQQLASSRSSAECEAANAIIALAVDLHDALGETLALRLVAEMVTLTGWKPPRQLLGDA